MPEGPERVGQDIFALLSDETRLAILRELAATSEEFGLWPDPLSYSELMERVGLDDSGNFNYHLDALRDRFVTKVDGGYRIRRAGIEIVRTLRAGSLAEMGSVDPTSVDERCPYCDAPIQVSVEDGWLLIACNDCPGIYGEMEALPDGLMMAFEVSPATRHGRSVEELFRVALLTAQEHAHLGFEGICPECTGAVETELEICSDHDTRDERICRACHRPSPAFVRGECTVCGLAEVAPPAYTVWNHEPTRRRLYDEGVAVERSVWARAMEPLTWDCSVERGKEVLLVYRVPVEEENGALRLTIDESLSVCSIE